MRVQVFPCFVVFVFLLHALAHAADPEERPANEVEMSRVNSWSGQPFKTAFGPFYDRFPDSDLQIVFNVSPHTFFATEDLTILSDKEDSMLEEIANTYGCKLDRNGNLRVFTDLSTRAYDKKISDGAHVRMWSFLLSATTVEIRVKPDSEFVVLGGLTNGNLLRNSLSFVGPPEAQRSGVELIDQDRSCIEFRFARNETVVAMRLDGVSWSIIGVEGAPVDSGLKDYVGKEFLLREPTFAAETFSYFKRLDRQLRRRNDR